MKLERFLLFSLLLLAVIFPPAQGKALATARFAVAPAAGNTAVPTDFDFDSIRFYDKNMSLVIPETDRDWIAVVFRIENIPALQVERAEALKNHITWHAQKILLENSRIIDFYYDGNLVEDGCFFQLRPGTSIAEIRELLQTLNLNPAIGYCHPMLRVDRKRYAFFNAFQMEPKIGARQEEIQRMLGQVHAFFDTRDQVYRVDIYRIGFFEAVNLLARDIRIRWCVPYLVELKPAITARLALDARGVDLGDKIPFSLRTEFSDRVRLEPSSFANIELRPDNIQRDLFEAHFDPYDHVAAAAKSPSVITGYIRILAPGDYEIAPVMIRYTCEECGDKQFRTFVTDPVFIRVASRIPDTNVSNRLVLHDKNWPFGKRIQERVARHERESERSLHWGLAGLFMALLCALAAFVMKASAAEKSDIKKEKSGERIARDALADHLRQPPKIPHWTWMARAANLFRTYLVHKYKIKNYPSGGTGSLFIRSVQERLPETMADEAKTIFYETDRAVAREMDRYSDMDSFKSLLERILHES